MHPIPPVLGTLALLFGRLTWSEGQQKASIQPLVQQVEDIPSACAIQPVDEDQDRDLGLGDLTLQPQELGAQGRFLPVKISLAELRSKFRYLEHWGPPLRLNCQLIGRNM